MSSDLFQVKKFKASLHVFDSKGKLRLVGEESQM